MSNRKIVTLRVSDHPQSHTINLWLDEQKNIQESLTNIMMHMIERFGIRNITDYDIQKLLYQDSTASNYANSAIPPVQDKTVTNAKEHNQVIIHEPKGMVIKEHKVIKEEIKEEQEDDLYSELDVNNL